MPDSQESKNIGSLTGQEIKLITNEIEQLASALDIPFERRRDAGWILRNAAINNSPSKKLDKLIKLAGYVFNSTEKTPNES